MGLKFEFEIYSCQWHWNTPLDYARNIVSALHSITIQPYVTVQQPPNEPTRYTTKNFFLVKWTVTWPRN